MNDSPTKLDRIRETHERLGTPNQSQVRKLVSAYRAATAELTAHMKRGVTLDKAEQKALEALLRAIGPGIFELDGEMYVAASRGERLFLRRIRKGEAVKL